MADQVVDERLEKLAGQLDEIKRQLHQTSGYPFDAKMLGRHLQLAIDGKFALPPWMGNFPVWRTLKRHGEASAEYYLHMLADAGVALSSQMQILLCKIDYTREPSEVRLVRASGLDVGWSPKGDYPYFGQLCEKARAHGLRRTPAWVAPQLALEYDQPIGETLYVASTPLRGTHGWIGYPRLSTWKEHHTIHCTLEARGYESAPNVQFSPRHEFVFSAE